MLDLKLKRLVVILAHPDDESFAVGGTLAKYAQQGVQVTLLCATRGEAGIPGLQPVEAGAIREQELRAAAKHLGIEVEFLGYRDGELSKANPFRLLHTLKNWMALIKPQVIITFGPEGVSGHPDHVTISHAVTKAYDEGYHQGKLLYIRPSEATSLGCGVSAPIDESDKSLVTVDISEYTLEKVRAIQSHESQNPGLSGIPEEEVDKIPCFEAFTVARDVELNQKSLEWFELAKEEQTRPSPL